MKQKGTALVLAAGIGKRFWPFTTSKVLFPFFEKPLLDFSVRDVIGDSISSIVLVASPGNKQALVSLSFPIPTTVVVQESAEGGMADAIRAAAKEISHKPLLVIIADDLTIPSMYERVLASAKADIDGVLPVFHTPAYFPGGYVAFSQNRPVGIVEKPKPGEEPSPYVYFGAQYFANADTLLAALERSNKTTDDQYEQALTDMMKTQTFAVTAQDEPFVSLKYPWHVLNVLEYLLSHRLVPGKGKHVEIRNNVSIEGAVYIGNNVKIFENTKIVGPVYIGDNTIIGNNNIIRDSYIGKGCVTGFNTDITRSYVGDSCWFHSNYIGDSVLEGNVSMGSGSVLANLRLDEGGITSSIAGVMQSTGRTKLGAMIGKNVRIGVNTSVMPGVKIGSDTMIGAGITIDQDIPDRSFCVGTPSSFQIKENKKVVAGEGNRDAFRAKL